VLALAHRPPLLVFDEPTDGLDPLARETTLSVLAEHIAEHAATLLISTHLVHETERLADHMGVLLDGTLRAQATTEEIQRALLRYKAEVPEGWDGMAALDGRVIRRAARGREIEWTVWGDEQEVRTRLGDAGAQVRDITRLSLEEAAVALLSHGGETHDR
jgi:ABC-2 type transport system ATP-binding protein